MSLRRLVVENYRCFRDRQEIELAPVTIVLGKNNSGKSVLTRAPLVIATGFDTDSTAPLALERLGTDAPDAFTDLIFEQNVHRKMRLGVAGGGDRPFELHATVQYFDERRTASVSDLYLRTKHGETRLEMQPDLKLDDGPWDYRIHTPDGRDVVRRVNFRGLLPDPTGIPELGLLRDEYPSLGPIRYLSPYRKRPGRQHRLPMGTPQSVGSRGEDTPGVLAHDHVRCGGELMMAVNDHLRAIVPGWELREMKVGPVFSTVLTRDRGRVEVNLVDAGSGLAQMLPIIVQCALDKVRSQVDRTPLQIIEEPETHLHPAAHAELANLYLETARRTGTRFLVETHSETLLLRLRRRIATDEFPPDMVAIYVVEQCDGVSQARRVEVDDMGNLEGWPDGYFSQDYLEVRALTAAQLRRSGHAS